MIVTVVSYKGGCAKTTTAVHLASYLALDARTLLIDGDPNRSATEWAKSGSLPYTVVDIRSAYKQTPKHKNIVVDTEARPNREDLQSLADGCDLLIIPATPDALSLKAMQLTIEELGALEVDRYRILLTIVPPRPSRDGEEAQAYLRRQGLPVFDGMIRRAVAFQKAALAGVTVDRVNDPRAGAAWEDYCRIGEEIRQLIGNEGENGDGGSKK